MAAAKAISAAFLGWFIARQFARIYGRISVDDARAMVSAINDQEFGGWFDVPSVLAIIEIESAFDPGAYRHEQRLNDASIGLMQTLYSTARDRGLVGGPAGLFDPETSIRIGMRQLNWSYAYLERALDRAPTDDEFIGSYNAGVGNVTRNFIPVEYVAKWRAARGSYV